jgi:hypothetical protein
MPANSNGFGAPLRRVYRRTFEPFYSPPADPLNGLDDQTVLAHFNSLIEGMLAGRIQRSTFQPWEIEILLDAMNCNLGGPKRAKAVVREYQESVRRQLEGGAPLPMKLSEFLASRVPNKASVLAFRRSARA